MKYTFSLKRNIFMYNHLITCTLGQKKYESICESAPSKENTIIFWPDDFGLPPEERDTVANELVKWSASQGFNCIINEGKGR